MKKGLLGTGIAMAVMVMFSAYAFADGGWGRGYAHKGDGYRAGGSENCPGFGKAGKGRYGQGSLSEEDAAKVEKARKAFFEETKELRQSMYQKRLAMRAEMAKKDPDVAKLAEMQKELSGEAAALDLKRLNHRLEMKKLLPDYHAGFGMERGQGHRRGPGQGDCPRQ